VLQRQQRTQAFSWYKVFVFETGSNESVAWITSFHLLIDTVVFEVKRLFNRTGSLNSSKSDESKRFSFVFRKGFNPFGHIFITRMKGQGDRQILQYH
jgi:hypothetical protein